MTTWKFATVPNVKHKKKFVKVFLDNNHLSLTLQDFFYVINFTIKKNPRLFTGC